MERSSHSRTFLDILLRRGRSTQADVEAISQGAARKISCHIRSGVHSLPSRFTYGNLFIYNDRLLWQRYLKRNDLREIPPLDRVIMVRDVGGISEWNIKRGLFKVVLTAGSKGNVEFAIPAGDVRILRTYVEGRIDQRD